MMPILTEMSPPSSASTMGHCAKSRLRSIEEPVVTKKSPSSSDRKGRMSASTCGTGGKGGVGGGGAISGRMWQYAGINTHLQGWM